MTQVQAKVQQYLALSSMMSLMVSIIVNALFGCSHIYLTLHLPYLNNLLISDHEVNLASILILENFAVPANQDDAPTPLSRYSSSESVLRLDGVSNSSASVAEKAMMFELTANMQNNRLSPRPKSNGLNDDRKSPSRLSPSPRKNQTIEEQNESNGSIKNFTSDHCDDKNANFQEVLTQQMNRSWADIMDDES